MTRGVPEEFLDTDLTYEIKLSKDSKEWTIIVKALNLIQRLNDLYLFGLL